MMLEIGGSLKRADVRAGALLFSSSALGSLLASASTELSLVRIQMLLYKLRSKW